MSEGGGSGSHILYQDFIVPSGVTSAALSFQVFVNNQASDFVTPDTLDYTGGDNQQARADLLLAGSDPFSVAGSDVLLTLFQTQIGDPFTPGYTTISADVSSLLAGHEGDTLRLRFAEVDNLQVLNFGVDDVRLSLVSSVPEPSALAMLSASAMTGSYFLARRRRLRS